MKMRRGYFAVILLAGLLSACGTGDSEDAALTPTGYPSGEVQQITVYYNGTRYWYTAEGFDQPLEDGFEKVGEVGRNYLDIKHYKSSIKLMKIVKYKHSV